MRTIGAEDVRLLENILKVSRFRASFTPLILFRKSNQRQWISRYQVRGAKTVTKKRVKELQQGSIQAEPLPEIAVDDAPQYPSVVQGARNNMAKFENCVLLTRVGNFYEVRLKSQNLELQS